MRIDARELASKLRLKAKQLLEAAAVIDAAIEEPDGISSPSETVAVSRVSRRSAKRGSRVRQLTDYLRKNGPQTRKEILAGLHIPLGSLSTVLASDNFVKDMDGRWAPSQNGDSK